MQAQIQKWGNSLGVRIPRSLANKLHIKSGTTVNLEASEHQITIIPETSELDLLLNNITDNNCYHEVFDDNKMEGNESW